MSSTGPDIILNPLVNSSWSVQWALDSYCFKTICQVTTKYCFPAAFWILAGFLTFRNKSDFSVYKFYSESVPQTLWNSVMEGYSSERTQFWSIIWCSQLVQHFDLTAKGKSLIGDEQDRKEKKLRFWLTWITSPGTSGYLPPAHTCLKCSISRYESWWNFILWFHIFAFILLAFLASAHNICNPASLK